MNNLETKRLSAIIGYEFKNPALLKKALTHRSASHDNNERLEFLGDSILSFVIASHLYALFPEESEGDLSRLRAYLVKGDTLAEIASELKLGDYLFLGQGEMKSGGFRRASILADTLEALIAALYLDSDLEAAKTFILKLYQNKLNSALLINRLKDPKTELQEWLQARKKNLPVYTLIKVEGDDHEQIFHVSCFTAELKLSATGVGISRRKAEQEAALGLLQIINSKL